MSSTTFCSQTPIEGNPANYPTGFDRQGDAIRIYNYVRLVRDSNQSQKISI